MLDLQTEKRRQIYKYFKLLSHSTSVFDCFFSTTDCYSFAYLLIFFSLSHFDNFFQVPIIPIYFFVCIWKDRWFFWSSFSLFRVHNFSFSVFSDLLFRYVSWISHALNFSHKPEHDERDERQQKERFLRWRKNRFSLNSLKFFSKNVFARSWNGQSFFIIFHLNLRRFWIVAADGVKEKDSNVLLRIHALFSNFASPWEPQTKLISNEVINTDSRISSDRSIITVCSCRK